MKFAGNYLILQTIVTIYLSLTSTRMKLSEVVELLDARVICGEEKLCREVKYGFASDLMSDVLTIDTENLLLITGMANLQSLRTAEMADIGQIVFVRNKEVTKEMIQIAIENEIVVLSSSRSMFRAIGILHDAGLQPVY